MLSDEISADQIVAITEFVDIEALPPEDRPTAYIIFGTNQSAPAEITARQYHRGVAPLVIATGGTNRHNGINEAHEFRAILRGRGVPGAAIRIEDTSANTWQNVEFSLPFLREALDAGLTVTAVCKWYHRRAVHILKTLVPDIGPIHVITWEPVYTGKTVTRTDWPHIPNGKRRVVREWEEVSRRVSDGSFAEASRTGGAWRLPDALARSSRHMLKAGSVSRSLRSALPCSKHPMRMGVARRRASWWSVAMTRPDARLGMRYSPSSPVSRWYIQTMLPGVLPTRLSVSRKSTSPSDSRISTPIQPARTPPPGPASPCAPSSANALSSAIGSATWPTVLPVSQLRPDWMSRTAPGHERRFPRAQGPFPTRADVRGARGKPSPAALVEHASDQHDDSRGHALQGRRHHVDVHHSATWQPAGTGHDTPSASS